MFSSSATPQMVSAKDALPGRNTAILPSPEPHAVLGSDLTALPPGHSEIYLAAGCYWGVEEIYWELPGVYSTSVGFMGGFTPNPTYKEVCTGLTGHAETVRVVFDPQVLSLSRVLQIFFECHDPTSVYQQEGDIGTQYRSALFYTSVQQAELAQTVIERYQEVLLAHGKGQIVTQLLPASNHSYYLAHVEHQQYLAKNPDGYRCHSKSGIACPLVEG